MRYKKSIISLLLIVALAIASVSLWLYEIWELRLHSFAWVYGDKKSAYMISALAALAIIIPFIVENNGYKWYKQVLAVAILTITNYQFYRLGKYSFIAVYTMPIDISGLLLFGLIWLVISLALFSAVYFLIIKFLLINIKKKTMFLFAGSVFLSMIVAQISIYIFPGFGNHTGWLGAIKMGYPMFWTCIFMGITGMILANKKDHPAG